MIAEEIKIGFLTRAAVPLADNEKISLWDDFNASGGSISLQGESLRLQGTWRVSLIGKFLGSGILGVIFIRPFFQKERVEKVPLKHIERIIVGKNRQGKRVYHLFQSREGGLSEVHTFTPGAETDASVLEKFLKRVVSQERFRVAASAESLPSSPVSTASEELKSCSNCGAKYSPADYNPEAPIWTCQSCRNPLPRN